MSAASALFPPRSSFSQPSMRSRMQLNPPATACPTAGVTRGTSRSILVYIWDGISEEPAVLSGLKLRCDFSMSLRESWGQRAEGKD